METIITYLKENYQPLAVIIYGSYANGTNGEDSDFDALLIVENGNFQHDCSVVAGVQLDVFVYSLSEITEENYDEFIPIIDGKVIIDTDDIGQKLKENVLEFWNSQPLKSKEEIQEELEWCRKMLARAKRGDAEGCYRYHWLLMDSLEIACDVLGQRYRGPKKSLIWLQENHPELFECYHRALQIMDVKALEEWIARMSYHIRQVRAEDAPVLARIQTYSWKAAFKGIISDEDLERCTDLEKATAMYSRLLCENKGNGYIGEVGGQAHCIAWWDKSRDESMPEYAELICIHSLPDNWRRGYGGQMMDKVLADIADAGYRKVMLWVFEDNERARRFYEAKGFTATDKMVPALGTTEVCYVREL